MPFPALSAMTVPSPLSSLPNASLSELQVGLARTGYPIQAIDGEYGPNTSSCWAAYCADSLSGGNPELVTPLAANSLVRKVDAIASIEARPQTTPEQVMAAIIAECNALGLTLRTQHAYVIATTYWETAHTFRPVREAFYLADPEAYLRTKAYYPFYGRGYVQLTWRSNYEEYGKITQTNMVNEPDIALDPAIALFVLVQGFKVGSFTGHKITDYINSAGANFVKARLCINGTDRATEIAAIADKYLTSLQS